MKHPYFRYEGTPLWRAVDAEIAALEANGDLEVTTAREYVIGSLCKRLVTRRLLAPVATGHMAATRARGRGVKSRPPSALGVMPPRRVP